MTIDPHELRSERFREIGSLIEGRAEELVDRWAARAIVEQPTADEACRSELRDGLPAWLRALGQSLANTWESSNPGHRRVAKEHGEQRWRTGWKLEEVVRDYEILRLVVLEFLDEAFAQSLSLRECMAVGLGIDEAIGASIQAYVTQRENELRDVNQKLMEFLAVLSHELRNFLTPLALAMELVQSHQAESSLEELHDVMRSSTNHLTNLVGDLLDVSRASAGKLTIEKTPVELQQVIGRGIEMSQTLVQERQHVLTVETPQTPIIVPGDPMKLTQVVVNLLHNACKYSPAHTPIHIELSASGNEAVIRVRDRGIGIAADVLPNIFKLFMQADSRPSSASGGLGIGLALVSKIVDLHGGSVSATSPGPNQGCEFTVRLPLSG